MTTARDLARVVALLALLGLAVLVASAAVNAIKDSITN